MKRKLITLPEKVLLEDATLVEVRKVKHDVDGRITHLHLWRTDMDGVIYTAWMPIDKFKQQLSPSSSLAHFELYVEVEEEAAG